MNDPHVVSLRYRVRTAANINYVAPPPIAQDEPGFRLLLENGVLTVEMKEHFGDTASAQARVRKYLRAWELKAELDYGPGRLSFIYEDSEVIDRQPAPSSGRHLSGGDALCFVEVISPTVSFTHHTYSAPPRGFASSPLVEIMMSRLRRFNEGREGLPSMGYVCLSAVQRDAGGRKKAAAKYLIDPLVLGKLGELSSDVGDENSARKFDGSSKLRPHTNKEQMWVLAAVKALIGRVAEYEDNPGAALSTIRMVWQSRSTIRTCDLRFVQSQISDDPTVKGFFWHCENPVKRQELGQRDKSLFQLRGCDV
jgi:hypothetical protein